MGEFWAPGAEIWLFKKKNMDRSIDLAVWHTNSYKQRTIGYWLQAYPIKQLQLTPIAVKFPFNASTKIVRAELVANKVSIKMGHYQRMLCDELNEEIPKT